MTLRRMHWIWIGVNALLAGLLVLLVLLATMRIELDPRPSYDGGPLTEVEIQREGVVERTFEDSQGVKHGPVTWWLDGVQSGGSTYVDDLLEGLYWSNWPDGTRGTEAWHVRGRLQGPFRSWHANGRIESMGAYVDGRSAGPWLHFDEQGTLDALRTGYYVDGERIDELSGAAQIDPNGANGTSLESR